MSLASKSTHTATAATLGREAGPTQYAIPSFDTLPDSAFVREAQLVPNPKRPGAPVPLPFSAPTLWRKVAAGTFPKPTKLSQRVTAWRVADVRAWMTAQSLA